jgi:hypothetical protein
MMISGPMFAPIAPNDNVPTAQMMTPSIAIPPSPSTARRLTAHSKSYPPCAELNDHRGREREGEERKPVKEVGPCQMEYRAKQREQRDGKRNRDAQENSSRRHLSHPIPLVHWPIVGARQMMIDVEVFVRGGWSLPHDRDRGRSNCVVDERRTDDDPADDADRRKPKPDRGEISDTVLLQDRGQAGHSAVAAVERHLKQRTRLVVDSEYGFE